MPFQFINRALLAGALFCTASLLTAQAASTIVTFSVDVATNIANGSFVPGTDTVAARGSFNGYGQLNLTQQGASTVYTNTVNNTTDANGGKMEYKFFISQGSNWENPASGQNRAVKLPSVSGASLVLPTPFFSDNGTPVANNLKFQVDVSQQIALGIFTNGSSTVDARGTMNGWSASTPFTRDVSQVRTTSGGILTSNIYTNSLTVTASPNGAEHFKFVISNGGTVWESPSSVNTDGDGSRYFANTAQTLSVVDFADQAYSPITKITFSVDMSAVLISDVNFNPATVTLNGDFNGWSADVPCTNNPTAVNTNIYTSTIVSMGAGSGINYQFRYNNGGTVYDNKAGGGNRYFVAPNVATTNVPAVYFNDVGLADLLNVDTAVTFQVDMNGAVGTDFHAFDPNNDIVFINGDFAGWVAWNPITLAGAGLTCTETNSPSQIYTYSKTFLKGQSRAVKYKFSINGGNNEAPDGSDHYRYIRSTNGVYYLPVDKFGTQTAEPKFGNLTAGKRVGNALPITWLGYPNVNLQTSTTLGGTWVNQPATTGASATNWPATSASQFFRLVQPAN